MKRSEIPFSGKIKQLLNEVLALFGHELGPVASKLLSDE